MRCSTINHPAIGVPSGNPHRCCSKQLPMKCHRMVSQDASAAPENTLPVPAMIQCVTRWFTGDFYTKKHAMISMWYPGHIHDYWWFSWKYKHFSKILCFWNFQSYRAKLRKGKENHKTCCSGWLLECCTWVCIMIKAEGHLNTMWVALIVGEVALSPHGKNHHSTKENYNFGPHVETNPQSCSWYMSHYFFLLDPTEFDKISLNWWFI